MNGTVSRVIVDKGFGFITGEDGQDYFFHRSDLGGFFDDLAADIGKGRKIKVTLIASLPLKVRVRVM